MFLDRAGNSCPGSSHQIWTGLLCQHFLSILLCFWLIIIATVCSQVCVWEDTGNFLSWSLPSYTSKAVSQAFTQLHSRFSTRLDSLCDQLGLCLSSNKESPVLIPDIIIDKGFYFFFWPFLNLFTSFIACLDCLLLQLIGSVSEQEHWPPFMIPPIKWESVCFWPVLNLLPGFSDSPDSLPSSVNQIYLTGSRELSVLVSISNMNGAFLWTFTQHPSCIRASPDHLLPLAK